jgi:hypothetical protein
MGPHGLGRAFHPPEDLLRLADERSARVRRPQGLADLLEERDSELLFELTNLARYRRLRQEYLLRRARVVEVPVDGQEAAQVMWIHRHTNIIAW